MQLNIPNKKGVEIAVKKVFKTLFPYNEKLTSQEIEFTGNASRELVELIFKGLTHDDKEITREFFDGLPGN